MAGMIWNANKVLNQCLSPQAKGIPTLLFHDCKGILLISVIKAGFVFTSNLGTGILLAKDADFVMGWSPPCLMGLMGVGWGFIVSAVRGAIKDVIIFLMDDGSLIMLFANNSIKFGGEINLMVGPWGHDISGDIHLSGCGIGATPSFAFLKGAFLGLSMEGAIVGAQNVVNEAFYGKDVTPHQLLTEKMDTLPKDPISPEVYKKLNVLKEGKKPELAEKKEEGDQKEEATDAAPEQPAKEKEETK